MATNPAGYQHDTHNRCSQKVVEPVMFYNTCHFQQNKNMRSFASCFTKITGIFNSELLFLKIEFSKKKLF
jgi:hypothetical protein